MFLNKHALLKNRKTKFCLSLERMEILQKFEQFFNSRSTKNIVKISQKAANYSFAGVKWLETLWRHWDRQVCLDDTEES